jgi:transposase InsO family protein
LLPDRDAIYGVQFREAATWVGIREVLTAPKSSWQNPYVERLIGSIRREWLDHVIVLMETSLHRILKSYFEYDERARTIPWGKAANPSNGTTSRTRKSGGASGSGRPPSSIRTPRGLAQTDLQSPKPEHDAELQFVMPYPISCAPV